MYVIIMFKFVSNNEKETKDIGFNLASKLREKTVVILIGDLGSGKTKLIEGFLSFFGIEEEIYSTNFTKVNE